MSDELMTMQEVAQILRMDEATVRRWARSGIIDVIELPRVKKNTRYRMRRTAFDAMLNNTSKKD
ncbi:MAG: hypothetical protein PVS3B3_33450 [Ktedonobacteraceae bacterium]